jgi:hypothetical protein
MHSVISGESTLASLLMFFLSMATQKVQERPPLKVSFAKVGQNCVPQVSTLRLVYLKGKAIPKQAWRGPEGYRKLRLPDLNTIDYEGGTVVSLTQRPPLRP